LLSVYKEARTQNNVSVHFLHGTSQQNNIPNMLQKNSQIIISQAYTMSVAFNLI